MHPRARTIAGCLGRGCSPDKGRVEMKPTRKLSRRSFLGTVVGGVRGRRRARRDRRRTGDRSAGLQRQRQRPNSDPAGRGRSCGGSASPTATADPIRIVPATAAAPAAASPIPTADPIPTGRVYGRGGRRNLRHHRSRHRRYADPIGNGRGRSGRTNLTDGDSGSNADTGRQRPWPARQPLQRPHRQRQRPLGRSGELRTRPPPLGESAG